MPLPRPKLPSLMTGHTSSISSKKAVVGAAGVAVVSGAVVAAASSGSSQGSNIAAAPVHTVTSGVASTFGSLTSGLSSFVPMILVAVGGVVALKLFL